MNPVEVIRGDSPIILGMPHTGTYVPREMFDQLTSLGQTLGDTDWHIERLYDGLLPGATVVRALFHRYVIDANRDPTGESLYPGQNTTGLVPLTNFDGAPLWKSEPDAIEIESRRKRWHAPYHVALAAEIDRARAKHGVAILYDCHSIRSTVPFLFEGVLPDFNIGTDNGKTCAPEIEACVVSICRAAASYTTVVNGRFKGGWTTRHYGRPENGVHAIQMELAQKTHLASETIPFDYDQSLADHLRRPLADILSSLETLASTLGENA